MTRAAEFAVGQRVRWHVHALTPGLTGVKRTVPPTDHVGTVVEIRWMPHSLDGVVPMYRVAFDETEVNHRGVKLGTCTFTGGLVPA